jgi:hypothetical protein
MDWKGYEIRNHGLLKCFIQRNCPERLREAMKKLSGQPIASPKFEFRASKIKI